MKKKHIQIKAPKIPGLNENIDSKRQISSFNPLNLRKVKQTNTSPIRFSQRLKQFFTVKRITSIIAAALFGCICRLCFFYYFPDLSINSFALLFPTSLGSIIAGAIGGLYYDHFLGIGMLDGNKGLKDTDCNKLFMDNSGSNSNRGTFKNTILELFNPVVEHYQHGTTRLNYAELQLLNNQGQVLGLFIITDINITNKTCTVTFLKPVSGLDNRAEVDLLKRLYQMFPNGKGYTVAGHPAVLDDHRLQGCIRNALDKANANPNSIYISDQNRPLDTSPRYNPHAPAGSYQPWASDIADSISRYNANNFNANKNNINLDSYSTIFLMTYANARSTMNPSDLNVGPLIRSLKRL